MSEKPTKTTAEWANDLFIPLYRQKYTQTLWNTYDPVHRTMGWRLKGNIRSPWFFNMRPVGDSPVLFNGICQSMAEMIWERGSNLLIGVEMAGVPLVGGISVATWNSFAHGIRFGYTRPLPKKVRKPLEALALLNEITAAAAGEYGEKSFVESRMLGGDRIAIVDDMATDLGSKIISRLTVLWEAKNKGIDVSCDNIFYFLNRNRGSKEKGLNFVNENEAGLYPAALNVDYVIEFDDHFPTLKKIMQPYEFEVIESFQKNPGQFQDDAVWNEVISKM